MPNELTCLSPEQFTAIEEFTEDLRLCFENHRRINNKLALGGELIDITMDYVLQTLDIHKDLAELKADRYLIEMEKEANK